MVASVCRIAGVDEGLSRVQAGAVTEVGAEGVSEAVANGEAEAERETDHEG